MRLPVSRRLRGGLFRTILATTVAASAGLLVATGPAHTDGVDYAAAAADEAYWISQAQVPDNHGTASGAITANVPGGGITSATDALRDVITMAEEPMTVVEQVQAFDVMHWAECRELRAGVEPLLDGAGSAEAVPR